MDEERLIVTMEDDAQKEKERGSIASKMIDGLQQVGTMGMAARATMGKIGDAVSDVLTKYRNSTQKTKEGSEKYRGMSSADLKKELDRINQELEEQKQILWQAQKKLAAYLENAGENSELGGEGSIA